MKTDSSQHWPDPGGRYGQDRPPGLRTWTQVRVRHSSRGQKGNNKKCWRQYCNLWYKLFKGTYLYVLPNLSAFHKSSVLFFPPLSSSSRWLLLCTKIRHRHRRNATSHHFTSLLFTSLYILTSLALINSKANTMHIHISNNSTFPFITKSKTVQLY